MKTFYRLLGLLFLLGYWIVMPVLISGCGTVTPERVRSEAASYDGNERNSGVIASTAEGFIVTTHFRARYNALIAVYGEDFRPALPTDEGIRALDAGRWLIDKAHMVKFLEMNAWAKMGKAQR